MALRKRGVFMDQTQPLTLLSIEDKNIEDCIYN